MSEYKEIANRHFKKLGELAEEKRRIEREMKNTSGLIKAVLNMMTDEEKGPYLLELRAYEMKDASLTQAIRNLLQSTDRYLVPTIIKQLLEEKGYDFSQYTSNPLSTIHTILKRFKTSEVDKVVMPDGSAGYKWKKQRVRKLTPEQLHEAIKGLGAPAKDAKK